MENDKTEYKREYTEGIRKAVVAFANSSGGTILVGVDDEGAPVGLSDIDATEVRISGMLRDSIRPDVTMFLQYRRTQRDGKHVLEIQVQRGTARPYYVKAVGLRPEGVYVRQGASSVPASEAQIRELIRATAGDDFEAAVSRNQNLTFSEAQAAFSSRSIPFGPPQKTSLGIIDANGLFTNLGRLLSDQCDASIKLGVFEGREKNIFRDRMETAGSLLRQLDEAYAFIDKWNHLHADYKGLRRIDRRDYPEEALREALLNAVVHRDYGRSAQTLVSIFDDRIEFVNAGGLLPDYELKDILLGVSVLRNPRLAAVFYRLEWIEAYGTGLPKINRSYQGTGLSPLFETSPHAFKLTLWNRNADPRNGPARTAAPLTGAENDKGKAILSLLDTRDSICRSDVESALHVSQGSAVRYLRALLDEGRIVKQGNGKNSRYVKSR